MDIVKLLQDLQGTIGALQTALADAQAAAESIAKESYDKGFADGVASVPVIVPDTDKIFSQADLDAAVEAVRGSMSAELEALRLQVADLSGQLEQARTELDGKIAAAVSAAIVSFKAELKAKYAESQAKESADEAAFGALLDEVVIEPVPEPVPETPVEPEPTPVEPQS